MSTTAATIDLERQTLGEVEVIGRDRWEEIRRRAGEGASIRAIARELDLDRKTVRRCLRQTEWRPYQRAARSDTLLATHAEYLRRRAPEVGYSAQVLFQELRGRQYRGSYETVKRFVRPLRETQLHAAVTRTRFETPPGLQSQVDWGQARVWLGVQRQVRHIFVLTLGFSRRSFYVPCLSERLGELLDAHEQAFTHFGGRTREHLYDRPRTVCAPRGTDGVRWNPTFKAFADFWGFEPRLCRPYRAQTKGKVESGVKYFKRNFLAGRRFRDDLDFNEQLAEWTATVADVRVHGTTHERPIDRFARERDALAPAPAGRAFRLEAPLTRVVATDYLVTVDTNRYSVPFTLIGQPVEVMRRDGFLQMRHRGQVVATHPVLGGRHQLRILPEHGPGPIARNARMRYST
ncbi:MAG: IS21 family transposase, partial [Acidobacteria bacterium]|nr:IS21 family transposase [Acidobacteriota bacterium]